MILIATVLSGLALLAASMALVLVIQEKKRNQKRSAATCDYVENECNAAIKASMKYTDSGFKELALKLKDLEDGIVPNYEDAKRAADSLNDFNRGIASIMGFDPFEALQKEQARNRTGVEE
jgi:hypothetical protein